MTPEDLPRLVGADPVLRRWGRWLSADVLLAVGAEEWMLRVRDGAVEVRRGPFLMPSWTLAIRIDPAAWAEFRRAEPPPGRHDVMALLRHGKLRLEGNLHPFFSHLLWFKGALGLLRDGQGERAAA